MIHITDLKVSKEMDRKELLAVRGGWDWRYFKTFNTRTDFGKISDGTSKTFSFSDGSVHW